MRTTNPIHPGITLHEDFMAPNNLSCNKLSQIIGVPPNRISNIVRGHRAITADTALRLERAFGVTAQFWLNLQQQHDLIVASQKAEHLDKIARVAA